VDLVQVRGKDLSAGALEELAGGWVARLEGIARVVVNDRIDVALAAGAGGAHLGADDIPLEEARRVVPGPFLLGASTHDREELLAAARAGADYAGLGAFFGTATKPGARALDVARTGLDAPVEELAIPVLAIGGIGPQRVADALRVPAVTGVAVSGAIQYAPDPAGAIDELRAALEVAWEGREA
jgi:thiamine-phosphate diphosphorylase